MDDRAWAVIAGYVLASGVGGLVAALLANAALWWNLTRQWQESEPPPRGTWPPVEIIMVGVVERVLYTSVIWGGEFLFIPVWLALKGLSRWGEWERSRAIFNIYLVGTAISLAFGLLGGVIVRELWPHDP